MQKTRGYQDQLFQILLEVSNNLCCQRYTKLSITSPQECHSSCHFCGHRKLLKAGSTAHSAFKIPASCGIENSCYVSFKSSEAQKLHNLYLILCAEIKMSQTPFIEAFGCILKDAMHNLLLFGREG